MQKETCKICNGEAKLFLTAPIFKEQEEINYFKCTDCGFIQTQEPTWLEKSYSDVITKSDIGLIWRNIFFSGYVETFLLSNYTEVKECMDYGGGYGVFVRIMRDKGFNFYWHDIYCKNMFAEGFEGSLTRNYNLITAFEVVEHLPNPHETISKLLKQCDVLVFSTELNDDVKDFKNWWYRDELAGQHISFFSKNSIKQICKQYEVNYYSLSNVLHVFSKKTFNQDEINAAYSQKLNIIQKICNRLLPKPAAARPTLLQKDHDAITQKYLKK